MKCRILFTGENKKNTISLLPAKFENKKNTISLLPAKFENKKNTVSLLPAKFAQRVVKVNMTLIMLIGM